MQTEPSWSHAAINSFFVSSSLNVIIVCLICFYKDLNSHRRRKVCCLLLKPPDSQLLFSFCRITKPHTRRSPAQEVSAHHIRLKLSPIRCLKIILELPWDFSRIFFFFSVQLHWKVNWLTWANTHLFTSEDDVKVSEACFFSSARLFTRTNTEWIWLRLWATHFARDEISHDAPIERLNVKRDKTG